MKFRKLTIERKLYGKDEGKLTAEIDVEGESVRSVIQLSDPIARDAMRMLAPAIVNAASAHAHDFVDEFMEALKDDEAPDPANSDALDPKTG